ncbi:WhiB family transcriptional regulator [Luteococcus sanguinis]|uniref:WhiB family transcriptional regulator n=1 Tax=Luteococcus sanguinis TaxID=174038 RepID=A0ABW1X0W2_9ACTN
MSLEITTDVSSMTHDGPAPCATNSELFWHPLVEDARPAGSPGERREQQQLVTRALQVCSGCPLVQQCLYQAVAEHNVSGVAGGTTPRQRSLIRSHLGLHVADERLDAFASTPGGRGLDHLAVLRMRLSNPNESLENLAHRLGCSLSTVKRHLRRARELSNNTHPAPHLQSVQPSREQVLHAARVVLGGGRPEAVRSQRAA